MSIYEYLVKEYGYNKPILTKNLNIPGVSYDNIRKQLSRLYQSGKIEKYAQGIYYIPTTDFLGKSQLSIIDVLYSKYIANGDSIYGYFSGLSFYNLIGISTQIPFVYEITTNKEKSRVREIEIDCQTVILKKPFLPITKDNYLELQFLDFINGISKGDLTRNRDLIISYVKEKKLKDEIILDAIKYYPSKTSKKLLESGVYHEFIRK